MRHVRIKIVVPRRCARLRQGCLMRSFCALPAGPHGLCRIASQITQADAPMSAVPSAHLPYPSPRPRVPSASRRCASFRSSVARHTCIRRSSSFCSAHASCAASDLSREGRSTGDQISETGNQISTRLERHAPRSHRVQDHSESDLLWPRPLPSPVGLAWAVRPCALCPS